MERNAVEGMTLRVLVLLDLDAVRIVGPYFMQGHEVRDHQEYQRQRQCRHMQGEEAVQGGIGDVVVAADPFDQAPPTTGTLLNRETMTCAPQ